MHNDLTLQELSDDELEMVVGGSHSHSQQSHSKQSHSHSHGHQNSKTYIVTNYYIINSTNVQISNGSSKNSSNNGTWASLG